MGSMSHRYLFAPFAAIVLLLAACGGSDAPPDSISPTAVAEPTPPSVATTAPAAGSLEPDGNRILADVKLLSDSGPRSSATDLEAQAANLIAERLRGLGLEVTLQEFSVGTQQGRSSLLGVLSPEQRTIVSLPLANSPTATVRGRLVAAGIGRPGDFPANVQGSIALIERGELLFGEKVANANAAGALGVVIYNDEEGVFFGSADRVALPTVTISRAEGQKLSTALAGAEVRVELGVGALSSAVSRNVVARAPGATCETITGGHYDSVPQAPGASDNASGTATILEIAAILADRDEIGNNCFVLFGAEELGLLGSKHFVSTLDDAARTRIKAMLNFDMVGVGEEAWWLIGTSSLQQRVTELAAGLGIETRASALTGTSSDHASFIAAGIPSVMFHRWQDPLLHTPQDVSDRVKPEYLEDAARMGLALLESLSGGG